MTLPAPTQLEGLSRSELLGFVLQLRQDVERLEQENRALREELEKLRRPPATSRNSSQPPARDQKVDLKNEKKRKKMGPPFGHQRAVRPLVDHPDRVIEAQVKRCIHCQARLEGVAPEAMHRRQVTELPVIRPVVIETRQEVVVCPHCQQTTRGELPAGLEADRYFGPQLEATIVYLKHEQHLSYQRVSEAMRDLFGVEVSEGGASAILERAGAAAKEPAAQIGAGVVESEVIGSDETSARVGGRNWWEWVFVSAVGIYHVIRPSRSAAVVMEVMGVHRAACWVSDCWSAQLKAPAKAFQLCLAHQLRDLERIVERYPRISWAAQMQELMREAIHLWKRREELTRVGYESRVSAVERGMDELLKRRLKQKEAVRLRQRYRKHRKHLLTFLHVEGVPPENNWCERALRKSVIHRKVTNGFRSEWGAHAYAALRTLIATARQQEKNVFAELVKLCGKPVLHFLIPQNSRVIT